MSTDCKRCSKCGEIKLLSDFNIRGETRPGQFQSSQAQSGKASTTLELLGCTWDQFYGWLEIQFEPGMTWDNYGMAWHVDHKKPCASFDLNDPAQQRQCFNYKNTQPLWAEENLKKGARILNG